MTERKEALAALVHETAEDHYVAYQQTDGVDPDWSIWNAGHLLENGIEQLLNEKRLKTDLVYLLVLADKHQMSQAPAAIGKPITPTALSAAFSIKEGSLPQILQQGVKC